jgi:hypothetical protein
MWGESFLQKLADERKAAADVGWEEERPAPSLLDTFGGAFVAFFFAAIFYSASVKIDDGFSGKALPDDYAVRSSLQRERGG